MGFFDRFKRKDTKPNQETVQKSPNIDRILVEDLIEQQYTCQEIAKQIGCTEQDIYNIKQAKTRREARMSNKAPVDLDDPVAMAKRDLEAERIKIQMEEIKLRREELELRREELYGSDDPDPQELAQDPTSVLLAGLMSGLMKQQPQQTPQQNINSFGFNDPIYPAHTQDQGQQATMQVSSLPAPPLADLSDQDITAILDQIPKNFLKKAQTMPDEVIINLARGQLPGYSDKTYRRALELLKKRKL